MGLPKQIPEEKTVCFVQITRFGDILQTIQSVTDLKNEYPNIKLIFVGRYQFAHPLRFLLEQYFDQIHLIKLDDIIDSESLKNSKNNIRSFLRVVNQNKIDLVINLSFSTPSSYLTSMISAPQKLGLSRNVQGELTIPDLWSQFVYSNVMRGSNNPFNLVDIFRRMIGVTRNSYENATHINFDKKTIIVHPFASSKKKSWSHHKWVELIYHVLKDNIDTKVVIVGAKNEAKDAEVYSTSPILDRFSHRIQNTVGKTTVEQLYNQFDNARLFIGHDSMVSHMSSIRKVQAITLSLGTVRPHETTPYGNNNYNVAPRTKCFPCFPDEKCDLRTCHKDLSYHAIRELVSHVLKKGIVTREEIKQFSSTLQMENFDIYRSEIHPEVGAKLETLSHNNTDIREVFRSLYSITWNFLLSGLEENLKMPKLTESTQEQLSNYLSGVKNLYELNNFGIRYSNYILDETSAATPNIAKIKEYSQKIEEIDQLSFLVRKSFPLLAPLVDLYYVAKGNLEGNNIIELAESSLITYHEGSSAVTVFYELIESIITKHKQPGKSVDQRPNQNM